MSQELVILGRTIGTYSGWDQMDTNSFMFYEFKPIDALKETLSPGDLGVNYSDGHFEYFTAISGDGNPTKQLDILDTLVGIKR